MHAMMGVKCQNAGNMSEIKTGIHVGVMPEIMEQRITMNEEYKQLNEELDEVAAGMAKILRVRQQTGELSDQLQAHLDDLKKKKSDIYIRCIRTKKQVDDLEKIIMKSREAKIRISGNVYKGTVISIDDNRMVINRDTSFMEYSAQNGVIVGTVVVI